MEDNIVGKQFGQWTIIEDKGQRAPKSKGHHPVIICQCSCGTIKTLPKSPFVSGCYSEKCFKCHVRKVGLYRL
jgi:hypothetical protein